MVRQTVSRDPEAYRLPYEVPRIPNMDHHSPIEPYYSCVHESRNLDRLGSQR